MVMNLVSLTRYDEFMRGDQLSWLLLLYISYQRLHQSAGYLLVNPLGSTILRCQGSVRDSRGGLCSCNSDIDVKLYRPTLSGSFMEEAELKVDLVKGLLLTQFLVKLFWMKN